MAEIPKKATNGFGKAPPYGAAIGECPPPARRQRVDASLPPGFRSDPAAREQARLLQSMEHRIDRALRQIEGAAAAPMNFLDHGIAMRRTRLKSGEHDHVHMPLEYLAAFHRLDVSSCRYVMLCLALPWVKVCTSPTRTAPWNGRMAAKRARKSNSDTRVVRAPGSVVAGTR